MKTIIINTCILISFALVTAAEEQGMRSVTVRTETFKALPAEEVRTLGFKDYPDVPEEENGAFDYIEAINILKTPGQDDYMPQAVNMWDRYVRNSWDRLPPRDAVLEKIITDNKQAIALIEKGSARKHCVFPIDAGIRQNAAGALLPHIAGVRNLARFMSVKARYEYVKGNAEQAVHDLGLLSGICSSLKHSPFLVSSLVQIAVFRQLHEAASAIVLDTKCTQKTVQSVLSILAEAEKNLPKVEEAFKGEKTWGILVIKQIFSVNAYKNMRMFAGSRIVPIMGGDPDIARTVNAAARILLPDRLVIKDLDQYYDRIIKQNALPYPDYIKARGEQSEVYGKGSGTRDWNIFAALMLPVLGRMKVSFVSAEAHSRITRGVCMLKLYYIKNRKWPDAVSSIAGFSSPDMKDPFSLEPLKYRTIPNGWILYSVGSDMKDGRGEEVKNQRHKEIPVRYTDNAGSEKGIF